MALHPAKRRSAKDYPPLVMAALVMLGLLTALPSALNLPQSTPTETVEYAPVPPDEDSPPPPPVGNFSSLGLGSSSGVAAAAAAEQELPPTEGSGRQVKVPGTKRCVGNPPRQTEDPLSPPCVGFFSGDNGGNTYQGVTRDEIRVLVIVTGYSSTGNYKGANEPTPSGKYYDLAEPAKESDHSSTRYLRAWQRYFNERYQTYGRFVHFFAYYPRLSSPESRRAEAAEAYRLVKPFAVVWPLGVPNIPAFNDVMHSKGVLAFTGLFALRAETFRRYPKLSWGYLPSLEEHASSFSAFVCEKVARQPVEFSGNPGENGTPRKYGLIHSAAVGMEYTADFVALVEPRVNRCGVSFSARRTHRFSGAAVDGRTGPDYAAEAMAAYQQQKITTIFWLFGYETNYSKSAAAINYRPEWILAGDGFSEGLWGGQQQEQSVWDHAVTFTLQAKTLTGGVSPACREAYLEVDPEIPRGTFDLALACFFFDELRQLFVGVQVAGPKLHPDTVDRGYHAIPPVVSPDPGIPACFYLPGDYTCVKDATVFWYDAEYQDETSTNTAGCWRLLDGGRRYTPGKWPEGNVLATKKDTDGCNGFQGGLQVAA